jgi:hypothetical protein
MLLAMQTFTSSVTDSASALQAPSALLLLGAESELGAYHNTATIKCTCKEDAITVPRCGLRCEFGDLSGPRRAQRCVAE